MKRILWTSLIGLTIIFSLYIPINVIAAESIDIERAEKLLKLGYYYELNSYAREILEGNPNDFTAFFYRGVGVFGTGNPTLAIEYFDKTLEIEPENKRALYFKSKSLFNLKRYDDSLLYINKALDIDPNYEEAKLHKETILSELDESASQNFLSEAERQARFATSFAQSGDFEEAHQFINKALDLDPTNVNVLNDKGWILLQEGELEEALKWFEKALEIDSAHPYVLYNMGWTLYQLGNEEKSQIWFERLQEKAPNHELISYIPSFGVKFQTYQISSIGLKFEAPENWIEEFVDEDLIVTNFRSPDNQAVFNVVFQYMPTNVSLDVIREFELGEIKQNSKNFILEDNSLISIGDDLGGKMVYTTDDFDITLKLMQIFMVKNNAEYVFSYASPSDSFEIHSETFQSIIDSIEIESVDPPILEHRNSIDKFKIEYPANWYLLEGDSTNGYMTSFISPYKNMEDIFPEEVNVVVNENSEDQSLENIVDELTEFYPDFIRDFKMIESQATSFNGIDAHKFIYTGKVVNPYVDPNRLPVFGSHPLVDLINIVASEEIDSKIMQIVFPHNDKIYVLTYRGSPNDFDSFLPEAEKVIDSFELEGMKTIPDWIKNNAKWWAEGGIGDMDFVTGIQYLIKEGIMTIPETAKAEGGGDSKKIPAWIKNNADWWAQGLISDDDFVKGIQFLVKEGIIKVS